MLDGKLLDPLIVRKISDEVMCKQLTGRNNIEMI